MTKLPEIKIFAFHYKPGDNNIGDQCYVHVWAGKNHSNLPSDLTGDDTGVQISSKNKYYSELSGIYWAWKNNTADVWGTCHYRRFYTIHPEPFSYRLKRLSYYLVGIGRKRHGLIYTSDIDFWKGKVISQDEVNELFKEYDAVMPVKRKLRYTVSEHYSRYHNIQDLNILQEIIKENCTEYLGTYEAMLGQKRLYANNMFVLRNEKFQELMEWLFKILFEYERRVSLNDYTGYQERIFGFLSERLITCWFMHNKLRTKELNLIYFKKLKKAIAN